jgi:hypothetical protein
MEEANSREEYTVGEVAEAEYSRQVIVSIALDGGPNIDLAWESFEIRDVHELRRFSWYPRRKIGPGHNTFSNPQDA